MVVSVQQACELLGCRERQIFYLLSRGVLERAPRYGKEIRIYRDSVEQALARPEPKRGRKPRRSSPAGFELEDVPL